MRAHREEEGRRRPPGGTDCLGASVASTQSLTTVAMNSLTFATCGPARLTQATRRAAAAPLGLGTPLKSIAPTARHLVAPVVAPVRKAEEVTLTTHAAAGEPAVDESRVFLVRCS